MVKGFLEWLMMPWGRRKRQHSILQMRNLFFRRYLGKLK